MRHHGPPAWLFEMLSPGPKRAERGEVRYLILDAIRDQARHGYDIIQTIESRTGGAYRPSAGTVYPTLQLLEEMGHARSIETEGRRVFEITEEGRADLDAHRDEVEEAYDRLGDELDWEASLPDLRALGRRVHRLLRTTGMAYRRGGLGAKELRKIQKVLDDAIDRIEEIATKARDRSR